MLALPLVQAAQAVPRLQVFQRQEVLELRAAPVALVALRLQAAVEVALVARLARAL